MNIPSVVLASSVLHNFCVKNNDTETTRDYINNGVEFVRNQKANKRHNEHSLHKSEANWQNVSKIKRDKMCTNLAI